MQILARVGIAYLVGCAVVLIALDSGWHRATGHPYIAQQQQRTQRALRDIDRHLREYREKHHSLPTTLRFLEQTEHTSRIYVNEAGVALDGWQRPYAYSIHGDEYRVTSHGRDGKPGGVGLDCDLTTAKPAPPEAMLTFQQYLRLGETEGMVQAALAAGVLAFVLSLVIVRRRDFRPRGMAQLALRILMTLVGAGFIGIVMAGLAEPVGH